MKVAVIYDSVTGNTAQLAQQIRQALPEVVYFGAPNPDVEADCYLVGSWTDRGMCSGNIGAFLKSLRGKRIGYFATAGFGGSETYYQSLQQRVAGLIDSSNTVLGWFFCQGKMPQQVRQRYEKQLAEHPDDAKMQQAIRNFDTALTHPDQADLERVAQWARQVQTQAF